jgi:hypothetical protein
VNFKSFILLLVLILMGTGLAFHFSIESAGLLTSLLQADHAQEQTHSHADEDHFLVSLDQASRSPYLHIPILPAGKLPGFAMSIRPIAPPPKI